ncbi:AP2 domain-containing protein (plasmid) [Staphylococcus warneri]|uniref:AP2 domain-containing protein n=1 Tax=Staphylococcus caprae TaxID=29380 RepID=UPI001188E2ED|nr:AP2 domain-containing protein [Staphylococcus caprae]QDW97555.1 AP2 domain-containing protein [Staphylococcus warneri]QJE26643.1 AP2 domain-containing protein [Staphylococcus caprae]HEK6547213.1 AP2 domain-containing protein [Staphylococcus aureus]
MKRMYLKHNNQYITIDDEDYEKIKQYDWYINKNYVSNRVLATINGKKVTLPHFITGVVNSYQKVKNLDFTRSNIGIDQYKHRYRKPQRNASSKYKGVRRAKLRNNIRYISSIKLDNERKHLGCFITEKEAARAYNDAVIKYWNGNGYLNDLDKEDD